MKFLKYITTLLTIMLALSAHATDSKALNYEVRISGTELPLHLNVPVNGATSLMTQGPEIEYISSATTLPAKTWKAMELQGTTPQYDFVECSKRTCTYGSKTRTPSSTVEVRIKPVVLNDVLMTSYRVVKSTSRLVGGKKGIAMPETSVVHVEKTIPLETGESYSVTVGSETIAVLTLGAK